MASKELTKHQIAEMQAHCFGKTKHRTKLAADYVILSRPLMEVYRCKYCNHYHVGHPPKTKHK